MSPTFIPTGLSLSYVEHNSTPSSAAIYPLNDYISYDSFSHSYKNFVLNISSQFEPQSFHRAAKIDSWKAAMRDELNAMEANNSWSVVPLLFGKQSIAVFGSTK